MSILPKYPFDGQQFVDAYHIIWEYRESTHEWFIKGLQDDTPIADENIIGLMTPHQLKILDSSNNGNFSIIIDTKLVERNLHPQPVYSGTALSIISDLYDHKLFTYENIDKDKYKGYTIVINNESSIILGNDYNYIILDKQINISDGDKFFIVESHEYNDQGLITGDIEFVSESINFTELTKSTKDGDCCTPYYNIGLSLSDDFIESYLLEIPGCKGDCGPQGDQGEDGTDGYDPTGPQGDPGEDGIDRNDETSFLTSVIVTDNDSISNEAIVELKLDKDDGILYAIKANISNNAEDADKLIVYPTFRDIELLGNDENLKFNIIDEDNTQTTNDNVLILKNGVNGDYTAVQSAPLREVIQLIINKYKEQYIKIKDKINKNLIDYVYNKYNNAKNILMELAEELSKCEWGMPIDFSLSLSDDKCNTTKKDSPAPSDTNPQSGGGGGGGGGAGASAVAIAKASVFIAIGKGSGLIPSDTPDQQITHTPIDTIEVPADSDEIPIRMNGSATLPAGIYTISYNNGSIYSPDDGIHIVGGAGSGVGLEAKSYDINGNMTTYTMPDPASLGFDNSELGYDQIELQSAYSNTDIALTTMMIKLDDRGMITLKAGTGSGNGIGSIYVDVCCIQIENC